MCMDARSIITRNAWNSEEEEDLSGWYYNQIEGTSEEPNDDDIISCVEYDKSGELLATGDRGGRIVVYQRDPQRTSEHGANHNLYCTFASHLPEFDYLKSLEIEEKINKIRWLPTSNHALFLLSTNDKTIKLWRISERRKQFTGYNLSRDSTSIHTNGSIDGDDHSENSESSSTLLPRFSTTDDLRVPRVESVPTIIKTTPKRIFSNAHAYLINSLSINSDQETFLSADDLRINLWNLQITDQSFNIVDIKPANMEDLSEVISAAQFHPSSCSLFVYSSSRGTIRLCDMRQRALCDQHALCFEESDDPTGRSFFSEIISSIADVNFSHSGRFILSRDYLTLKVWDMNMSRQPVETYLVHEYFRGRLCSLYENDYIFDKFECQWSPDDRYVMTGSYNNHFRVFDRLSHREVLLEVSHEGRKVSPRLRPRQVVADGEGEDNICIDAIDYSRKLLHMSWHPYQNSVALAGANSLYLLDYLSCTENGISGTSSESPDILMQDAIGGGNLVDASGDTTSSG